MGEVVTFIRRQTPNGKPGKPCACAGQILLFTGAWRERYDEAIAPLVQRRARKTASRATPKRRKKA